MLSNRLILSIALHGVRQVNLSQDISKRAAVVGSIQSRSWDGNDGKKQYATEVVVDEAYFTGSRAESGTQGGGNYQNQGFNQGGFNAPQSQPAQGSEPNFGDDFDMGDFSDLDGSEDDLPF